MIVTLTSFIIIYLVFQSIMVRRGQAARKRALANQTTTVSKYSDLPRSLLVLTDSLLRSVGEKAIKEDLGFDVNLHFEPNIQNVSDYLDKNRRRHQGLLVAVGTRHATRPMHITIDRLTMMEKAIVRAGHRIIFISSVPLRCDIEMCKVDRINEELLGMCGRHGWHYIHHTITKQHLWSGDELHLNKGGRDRMRETIVSIVNAKYIPFQSVLRTIFM